FDRLLTVLSSNYFQPAWPAWQAAGADEVERAIRKLQIPRGRARLIEQLTPVGGDSSRRSASGDASYSQTLAVVNRLAVALDALPQRATLPDWAKAWERLAEETGLLRAMGDERGERGEGRGESAPPSATDRDAWQRLIKVLADSKTLDDWLDRHPAEIDRCQAFETLMDILGSDQLKRSDDESGRVRVLSATSVRSLRIPHLFLAGLSEKVFPPPDREDRLYGEQECWRLIDAGLPLVARAERTREEMLLFYEAVTRATERLYLSYPALDEAAQPLLPSPFLGEVEQAFGPGQITRVEQTDLSPVPRDDEPLSAAEFRVKAVATALEGNVALLAGLMGGTGLASGPEAESRGLAASAAGWRIAAGLKLLYSRQDRERFGPAEGVLRGTAARHELASEFSSQHTFAATELERYAYCPFRFFIERILKIEPVEDLALEFDVLSRGRVAHEVLSYFHKQVNLRLGRPASPLELDSAEFDALVNEAVQNSLPPEPSNPVDAAMREIDRRLVVEWMSRYREQVEKYDAQWKGFDTPPAPELFEVAFGRGNEGPPSTDKPLEFLREGETIRVSGRIDRVDVGAVAGRGVFVVLDYKTGGSIRVKPKSVKAGTTLQLPLYSLAAMELLLADRDLLPWRAGYWYVRNGGYKPRQALRMYFDDDGRIELDQTWEELRAGLGDTVAELVHAMRRGCFPVCCADDRCTGRCPYGTVCRVNHVRSLEKTCRPTDND
ncbi:MAG: PD-(D/E)XK nuclease family protein, partial [Planctomycetes bacterium]|nr:PD-(D/E)XK nuclease family protein [Planctomycetota bacterium]